VCPLGDGPREAPRPDDPGARRSRLAPCVFCFDGLTQELDPTVAEPDPLPVDGSLQPAGVGGPTVLAIGWSARTPEDLNRVASRQPDGSREAGRADLRTRQVDQHADNALLVGGCPSNRSNPAQRVLQEPVCKRDPRHVHAGGDEPSHRRGLVRRRTNRDDRSSSGEP